GRSFYGPKVGQIDRGVRWKDSGCEPRGNVFRVWYSHSARNCLAAYCRVADPVSREDEGRLGCRRSSPSQHPLRNSCKYHTAAVRTRSAEQEKEIGKLASPAPSFFWSADHRQFGTFVRKEIILIFPTAGTGGCPVFPEGFLGYSIAFSGLNAVAMLY